MASTRNYNKSNRIQTVDFYISKQARRLTGKLLTSSRTANRQALSKALLDELSALSEINPVTLNISDTNQYHKKKNGKTVLKQYGYYKPDKKYIYINNKTAVRGQILAPKTFIDTLIHEWVHHYDTEALKLNSIHTKGFYERVKDLKTKLGFWNTHQ